MRKICACKARFAQQRHVKLFVWPTAILAMGASQQRMAGQVLLANGVFPDFSHSDDSRPAVWHGHCLNRACTGPARPYLPVVFLNGVTLVVNQTLIVVCANCGKVRRDTGQWTRVVGFSTSDAQLRLSHTTCPTCTQELYPEIYGSPGKTD